MFVSACVWNYDNWTALLDDLRNVYSVWHATIPEYTGINILYELMNPKRDRTCFLVLGIDIDMIMSSSDISQWFYFVSMFKPER